MLHNTLDNRAMVEGFTGGDESNEQALVTYRKKTRRGRLAFHNTPSTHKCNNFVRTTGRNRVFEGCNLLQQMHGFCESRGGERRMVSATRGATNNPTSLPDGGVKHEPHGPDQPRHRR